MSKIAVPSRFACLKIEGDDEARPKRTEKPSTKQNVKKIGEKPDKNKDNKKSSSKQKKGNRNTENKQWDAWKEKDDELVSGHYERDLQSAILQSKLDFEQNKDLYQKNQDDNGKKNDKKKKGTKTMSLDQFLGNNEEKSKETEAKHFKISVDENFFEKVATDLKQQLTKEKVSEDRKTREANIEEIITSSQYHEKLKLERIKNERLEKEIESLKSEIADVKNRNRTLCKILGHGEMKDKADVLIELEKLTTVKNELTEEVAKLHILLEQERSKVAALSSETQKGKDKKSKKHA